MSIARRFTSFTQREIRHFFSVATRVVKEPELTILVAPAALPFGRLLVVTSRSVGNAPARNRIRRRIKAIFYEQKLFALGFDFAVIIKSKQAGTTVPRLQDLINRALNAIAAQNRAGKVTPHE